MDFAPSTQDLMTSTTPRHKQMHKPSASDSGIFIENIAPPTDVDKKDNQSSLPLPDFHNNENGNNGNDVTVASPTHPPAKGPKLQRSFHASHTTVGGMTEMTGIVIIIRIVLV